MAKILGRSVHDEVSRNLEISAWVQRGIGNRVFIDIESELWSKIRGSFRRNVRFKIVLQLKIEN